MLGDGVNPLLLLFHLRRIGAKLELHLGQYGLFFGVLSFEVGNDECTALCSVCAIEHFVGVLEVDQFGFTIGVLKPCGLQFTFGEGHLFAGNAVADFVYEVLAGGKYGAQHLLRKLGGKGLHFNPQQAGGFVVVGGYHALVVAEQVFARGVLVEPEEHVAALGGILLDPVQALFEQQHHVH